MSVASQSMFTDYHVADMALSPWGHKEIRIAETEMPGLMQFAKNMPEANP